SCAVSAQTSTETSWPRTMRGTAKVDITSPHARERSPAARETGPDGGCPRAGRSDRPWGPPPPPGGLDDGAGRAGQPAALCLEPAGCPAWWSWRKSGIGAVEKRRPGGMPGGEHRIVEPVLRALAQEPGFGEERADGSAAGADDAAGVGGGIEAEQQVVQ